MAVCTLRRLLLTVGVWLTLAAIASACFGPKLYLGAGEDADNQLLVALVAVYVHGQTGIEVVRQPLTADPVDEIRNAKVDFAFADETSGLTVLLSVDGKHLASGSRILEELQFTTVRPALERLQQRLRPEHLELLKQQVKEGALPMAAVRTFLLEQGWI